MKAINNWDNVQPIKGIDSLPGGGYIIQIRKASEVENRNGGGTHLEILFDIHEGDYKGFFERDYRAQTREDKFWRGVINQNIPQEGNEKYEIQCRFFRTFIEAIEDSNPGYRWAWNEATLKEKICGCIFGEQEKVSQKGNVYVVSKAESITSAEDIRSGKFKVPAKKVLPNGQKPVNLNVAFEPIDADEETGDLPF